MTANERLAQAEAQAAKDAEREARIVAYLRDKFAGQALIGFLAAVAGSREMEDVYESEPRVLREHAEAAAATMYIYADAMLKARNV